MKAHQLIVASAGSGKTHQLTRHFIEILLDGQRRDDPAVVERILAATFTRAAAGEISQRILVRLSEAIIEPEKRHQLVEEPVTDDDCIKLLQSLVRRMNRLRICTLDSFLVRSAQCFAPELGLSFPWTILDDQANRLLCLEATDAILAEAARTPQGFAAMKDLLIQLNSGRLPTQVRERLVDHFDQTYALLGAGPGSAWDAIAPDEDNIIAPDALSEIAAALAARLAPHIAQTKSGQPRTHWVNAANSIVDCATRGDWKSFACITLIGRILEQNAEFDRCEISTGLAEILQPLIDHAGASLLSVLRDRNRSTRDLLLKFDHHYRFAKARRSAYRFDDFTSLLIDAGVVQPDLLGDFYYRLDGRIDHILLDEFQDTSIAQWRLMEPLVDEIMSGEGAERGDGRSRSFFCVGDVKQTLYSWRNAEPRLLHELTQRWKQLKPQPLVESRRSSPVVIGTVNRIFTDLISNPAITEPHLRAAAEEWDGWFEEHDTHLKDLPGFARLLTCEIGDTPTETAQNAIRFAADRAAALHRAMPDKQIAILLRRKRFINQIIFRLSHHHRIECSGEGGSPLIDDPAVCAALSMLQLIEHPADTAALYHVGHSPLGRALKLAPDAPRDAVLNLTKSLRGDIIDRGIPVVLNGWLRDCAAHCDERNVRRFRQLIELAAQYPYDGGDLSTFVQYVRAKRVEDVTAARVRVMTIHASKGRQFAAVILPDLDGDLVPSHANMLIDREHLLEPATCITSAGDKIVRQFNPRLAKMEQAWKTRQAVEELCTLYVGMTRAEVGLEMIVHPRPPLKDGTIKLPKSPAGVVCAALLGAATGDSNDLVWEHDDSIAVSAVASSSEKTEAPAPLAVHIAPAKRSRVRPQATPSSLEGGGHVDLHKTLDFAADRGRDRGRLMHRCFQHVEWLDNAPADQSLREALVDVSDAEIAALLRDFRSACKKPNLAALLARTAYKTQNGDTLAIWRERPFYVRDTDSAGREVILNGIFDRVVVIMRNNKPLAAELIDFKTDSLTGDGRIDELKKYYKPQIDAYRRALAKLTGLAPSQITSKLMFLSNDVIVNIT